MKIKQLFFIGVIIISIQSFTQNNNENVDLGIIDNSRRSSYAYDSPSVISKNNFKSITTRRPSFGRMYDLEEVLDEV